MSREYVEARIREALKLHKNNATRARQQVIAWTKEDARLLQALAHPHLTGIVAHAINRVIYRGDTDEDEAPVPELPESLNMPPETFGQEILKALSGSGTIFGRESSGPQPARRPASKRHIDALKMMAKKSTDGKTT